MSATGNQQNSTGEGVLSRLDMLLEHYFASLRSLKYGTPSVAYCAAELELSANYFGSLVKRETGISARDYIMEKLFAEAKSRILSREKNINEIAYELGFRYPQHFSRSFKKLVGESPKKYGQIHL